MDLVVGKRKTREALGADVVYIKLCVGGLFFGFFFFMLSSKV